MYCKDIMIDRHSVISVPPEFTLSNALARMDLYGFRTLPVVSFAKYFGVIDKYSIYESIYIKRDVDLDTATVIDVMRTDIQHVFGRDFIEKAAMAFIDQRYQFVPVLMDQTPDQFMGIIPIATIMDIFTSSMGLGQPAHRLTLDIDDYKGELARLTKALLHADAKVISLVTVESNEAKYDENPRVVIVVKFEGDLDAVVASCRTQGARITHIDRYDGEDFKNMRFLPWLLKGGK